MVGLPWTDILDGLPLKVATPRAWTQAARGDLRALLADHAHCEQKAASMAIALIGRFPDHPGLARSMIALAHEEMSHFRQVLDRIEARGERLTKPLPDRYVRALREWAFRHRGGIGALGDLLLVSAFVEARSCERFRLLAETFVEDADPGVGELGQFYGTLADAERRHWERFRELALAVDPDRAVEGRFQEMADAEAKIVLSQPIAPRMH
jgi:tRNA 2-(methylsulfanyl)-N6-isopentenyladenosine37 hydroxylase